MLKLNRKALSVWLWVKVEVTLTQLQWWKTISKIDLVNLNIKFKDLCQAWPNKLTLTNSISNLNDLMKNKSDHTFSLMQVASTLWFNTS